MPEPIVDPVVPPAAPPGEPVVPPQGGTLIGGTPGEPAAPPEPPVDPAAPAAPLAPEKYEFSLGEGVNLDTAVVERYSATAKELDLPQDKAQKLLELGVQEVKAAQEAVTKSLEQEFMSTRDGWKKALASDETFGGAKQAETLSRAQRVLDEYFPADFREFLGMGFGDNNHLIIGLAKIDQMLGESRVPRGGSSEPTGSTPLWDGLYKNSNMNK